MIVPIAEGEWIIHRDDRELSILAAHDDVTISYASGAPGLEIAGPHVHHEHTDAFYVLDGELAFEIGRERTPVALGAGGFVVTPPDVAHSVRTAAASRWLNFHAGDGGFASFLRGLRDGDRVDWDMHDVPADGGLPASAAILSRPGEGERLESGNRLTWLKCALPELCFVEWYLRGPHPGPPIHRHERGVDSFYVIEGEIEAIVEDRSQRAGAGTLFSVPRGVEHTFNYHGPAGARMLNIHTPDNGFADFLRRVSD